MKGGWEDGRIGGWEDGRMGERKTYFMDNCKY
jgi:hypothetical protein